MESMRLRWAGEMTSHRDAAIAGLMSGISLLTVLSWTTVGKGQG